MVYAEAPRELPASARAQNRAVGCAQCGCFAPLCAASTEYMFVACYSDEDMVMRHRGSLSPAAPSCLLPCFRHALHA